MRLLELDDDILLHVVAHAREHAAFTVLVCKRLRRLTAVAFHPMPVTCRLGTLLHSQATLEVYKYARCFFFSGGRCFEDAVLLHGEESFVKHVCANSNRVLSVDLWLKAGRVDFLIRSQFMHEADYEQALQPATNRVHDREFLELIRFLCADFTGEALQRNAWGQRCSSPSAAHKVHRAEIVLVQASMAPGPATLKCMFDWIHRLAAVARCNLAALLAFESTGVKMLRAAIREGGPGNIAYIQEQIERAKCAFGVSHPAADHIFLGICAYIVSNGHVNIKHGYAVWEFLQSVDWKARGCTLSSAVDQYKALARPDAWAIPNPESLLVDSVIFKAIRDERSLSIVRSALEVDGGWLVDAFNTACTDNGCVEYVCLFGNDGSSVDIGVVCECTKRIALEFLLFDGASSCFVTKAMFKLLNMTESGELSAGMKVAHHSCTLVSELWAAATSDGTRGAQKRARRILYGNNFVFHTLIVSFKCKQIHSIDAMLERTPVVASELAAKQRNYLVWQGSRCYAPEQLSPIASKLLSVPEPVARERCCAYRAPPGYRRLPDFRCCA